MKVALRTILALVAGAVTAFLVIACLEQVGSALHPPPPGLDMHDRAAMRAFIATLPWTAFVLVLIAWGLGVCLGGYLAGRLAPRAPVLHASAITMLVALAAVANLLAIPHPAWFWASALIVIAAAGHASRWLLGR
ncbi:MAG TPA: hypothetical protein VMQ62_02330 [Dongiaceae bacterium]|nr:hypothetical protein [Dongiaceae bacterium]